MFAIHQVNSDFWEYGVFWRQGGLIKITKQNTIPSPCSWVKCQPRAWGTRIWKHLEVKGTQEEKRGERERTANIAYVQLTLGSLFRLVLSPSRTNMNCVHCQCYSYLCYDHYNNTNISLNDSSLLPVLPREDDRLSKNRIHLAILSGRNFEGTTHLIRFAVKLTLYFTE